MIISDHIPGQEYGNVSYIREHNAGVYARGPERVAQVVQKWLTEAPDQLRIRAENARKLARPNAVWEIVEELWHHANLPPVLQPQKPKRGSAAQRRFQRSGSRNRD